MAIHKGSSVKFPGDPKHLSCHPVAGGHDPIYIGGPLGLGSVEFHWKGPKSPSSRMSLSEVRIKGSDQWRFLPHL